MNIRVRGRSCKIKVRVRQVVEAYVSYQGKRIAYGIARCNPEDEYREDLGRQLAEGRVWIAAHAHFWKEDWEQPIFPVRRPTLLHCLKLWWKGVMDEANNNRNKMPGLYTTGSF